MAVTKLSSAAVRLVKILVGRRPQTVSALIRATGVTRTAVSEQLKELFHAGYVTRTIERLPGRGRPRYLFSSTPAAELAIFANDQPVVVPAIWKAIRNVCGPEAAEKVRQNVCDILVERYGRQITATEPRERLQQFVEILEKEGGMAELESIGNHLKLTKRTCGFIGMYEEERDICKLDLQLISGLTGATVTSKSCRHDGAPCCEFIVDLDAPL